ncbi:MAG: LysM peptidoglycan-binding domain-containing protein [Hyphomicrobiales bacterium]|nr:LysM peptidoglycan-binding domain-containing protein [Hyphomicrobiales bacterium]
MAYGIRNALLFGGGALVAAFAVAYGLGAFTPASVEKVAQTAGPTGNSTTADPAGNSMTAKEGRMPAASQKPAGGEPASKGDAAPAGNAATADSAAAGSEAAGSKKATEARDVTAPSFDVVRVEGNGSIVVAGRSAPGAKVEILSGKSVLGTSTAGAEGDFAIVLDNPLKPGDYQLVLRATTPANLVAMSKETAVVSIPEHQNGQVLALVEAPGQPSKLITVPKPERGAVPAPAVPAATQAETAENKTEQKPATQPSGDGTRQPAPGNAGQETASAALPAAKGTASDAAQVPAKASAAQSGSTQPEVSVEAVEIEGNKIFVAGVADPGSTVRVYANDMVLGEAKTSPVGRFLVESIHELAVGDYIIRADMLAPDGVKVAARAAVPFTRAPGESVAAVASGEAGSRNAPNGTAAPAGSGAAAPSGTAASNDATSSGAASPVGASSGDVSTGQPSPGEGSDGGPQAVASGAKGSAVLPSLDSDISKQPPTIVSPKLQETSGAVIIRRGDTLWQISRRVYGHGVRYSTIYLANQDQIENPDLIWPGQIFAVPGETKEGDAADMKAIAGQATQLPQKAVE